MDSNHRPRAYQARALTTWATNRYSVLILPHLSPPVCFSFVLFSFTLISEEWKVKSEEVRSNKFERWWRWWDSNPWPPACRAGALPTELHPHTTGSFLFSRIMPVPENWTTKDWYIAIRVPTSSTRMTESWHPVPVSIERRWSSRTFRYGYLVTT